MSFTGTYISSDSFSVSGDQRAFFIAERALCINCGGEYVFSAIESVTYSAPNTIVTIYTTNLTNPLTDVYVGVHPFSIPIHAHDSVTTGGIRVSEVPGSVWRSGNGAPSDSLGIDGDYYLDEGPAS